MEGVASINQRPAFSGVIGSSKQVVYALSDFQVHTCRHTFASRLVGAGVDLYVVKELMGHSIAMTKLYAHLQPERKQAAVDVLEKLELAELPILL